MTHHTPRNPLLITLPFNSVKFLNLAIAWFSLGLVAVAVTDSDPEVPLRLWDIQIAKSTETRLHAAGQVFGRQSIVTEQASFLRRFPTELKGWFFGAGLQGESFSFGGSNRAAIGDLQDVAGMISAEYFVDGTQAASMTLKPGFYFSNRVHSDCFDIPVQLVSGIPLTHALNGVVGGADARFYHHPIPIVGLSWTMAPGWRLDAVFPEPALVYTPRKGVEAKLGGELQSGGFRSESGAPVEFYSYQCKARLTYAISHSVNFTGAVGYEVERRLDYVRGGPNFKSEGAVVLQFGGGIAF